MSRVMHRTPITTVPDSTLVALLTCPAGHKYEVLWLAGSGNGAQPTSFIVASTQDAAGQYLAVVINDTAPWYSKQFSWPSIVLLPGDNLAVETIHAGGVAGTWQVTYIDVSP